MDFKHLVDASKYGVEKAAVAELLFSLPFVESPMKIQLATGDEQKRPSRIEEQGSSEASKAASLLPQVNFPQPLMLLCSNIMSR